MVTLTGRIGVEATEVIFFRGWGKRHIEIFFYLTIGGKKEGSILKELRP